MGWEASGLGGSTQKPRPELVTSMPTSFTKRPLSVTKRPPSVMNMPPSITNRPPSVTNRPTSDAPTCKSYLLTESEREGACARARERAREIMKKRERERETLGEREVTIGGGYEIAFGTTTVLPSPVSILGLGFRVSLGFEVSGTKSTTTFPFSAIGFRVLGWSIQGRGCRAQGGRHQTALGATTTVPSHGRV